jgi:hypothetical protein
MRDEEVVTLIRQRLPELMRTDPEIRGWILDLGREYFADRAQTDARFEQMLAELRQEREDWNRRFEEEREDRNRRFEEERAEWRRLWEEEREAWDRRFQEEREAWNRRWEEERAESERRWRRFLARYERRWQQQLAEWNRRWEEERAESQRRWEEERAEWNRRWEEERAESQRRWEEERAEWNRRFEEERAESQRRWEEQRAEWNRRWEEERAESQRRWEENQKEHQEFRETFRHLLQRIDTGISAIGARWGIFAESAFRNGIQAILEESFGVQVLHYQGYDETGDVFGHPDQVELDLIIRDSTLIVCEIKSSMSRSDMYTFDRKVRFYERREGRRADRKMVISPMVEEKALQIAQKLGIEVYTHADEVRLQEAG